MEWPSRCDENFEKLLRNIRTSCSDLPFSTENKIDTAIFNLAKKVLWLTCNLLPSRSASICDSTTSCHHNSLMMSNFLIEIYLHCIMLFHYVFQVEFICDVSMQISDLNLLRFNFSLCSGVARALVIDFSSPDKMNSS